MIFVSLLFIASLYLFTNTEHLVWDKIGSFSITATPKPQLISTSNLTNVGKQIKTANPRLPEIMIVLIFIILIIVLFGLLLNRTKLKG